MENELKYKGYTIEIVQDEHAESPDNWGNDDAFLVYDHRQFTVTRKGFDPRTIFEDIQARPAKVSPSFEGYHVFTVFAYIHSGVSLSLGRTGYPFNDRWDVSSTGFILVKKQKEWSWTREKAEKIAQSIVNEWNDYLSGNVYGFQAKDSEGNIIDSCWGFYGDQKTSGILDQAKGSVDHEIRTRLKARIERLKTLITNKVPLNSRLLPSLS